MSTMSVVYAHRGGASLAPENTLGAFRQAHTRLGAPIELDVRLTRDGVPVVLHDPTLDRTTDRTGPVAELDADDVTAADAAHTWDDWGREPVPTFEDVLREGARSGWRLMVELKASSDAGGRATAAAVVEGIEETGFPSDDLFCACFRPAALREVKARAPGIRTAVLTASLAETPRHAVDAIDRAAKDGHDLAGPDLWAPDLGPDTVARAHDAGLELIVWTVNDPDDVRRLADDGVDGIISDRPDIAADALAKG